VSLGSWIENKKQSCLSSYEKHEIRFDLGFFVAGFLFDVVTLSDVDDPWAIGQQVLYLTLAAGLLAQEYLTLFGGSQGGPTTTEFSQRWPQLWRYRQLMFHFILGSLMSVYSLFFLKSASIFNSVIFVIFIMGLMVANELKAVQQRGLALKVALFVLCLFSFFSMTVPVILGFVGVLPFALALLLTGAVLYWPLRWARLLNARAALRQVTLPSALVLSLFIVFYAVGWVPPVPLSLKSIGVYHELEKRDGRFILSHENPWFRFWSRGDQDFKARPGDRVFVFARVFAPRQFKDELYLHWMVKEPRRGWVTSDRVRLTVVGGREDGFRAYSFKENYRPGEWRVFVETSDQREIGRVYFDIEADVTTAPREFTTVVY
jgi:Protein of unknown function (DUF2914)